MSRCISLFDALAESAGPVEPDALNRIVPGGSLRAALDFAYAVRRDPRIMMTGASERAMAAYWLLGGTEGRFLDAHRDGQIAIHGFLDAQPPVETQLPADLRLHRATLWPDDNTVLLDDGHTRIIGCWVEVDLLDEPAVAQTDEVDIQATALASCAEGVKNPASSIPYEPRDTQSAEPPRYPDGPLADAVKVNAGGRPQAAGTETPRRTLLDQLKDAIQGLKDADEIANLDHPSAIVRLLVNKGFVKDIRARKGVTKNTVYSDSLLKAALRDLRGGKQGK